MTKDSMQALVLTKNGDPEEAFSMEERPVPQPAEDEVLVEVEASGLNFADVMSRRGMYREAPPIPFISGYEVVGRVCRVGSSMVDHLLDQRVVAFTRFGGYAQYAVTKKEAVAPIGEDMDAGKATALATQYCTAWFSSQEATTLHEGDNVLVHAAAGGVGTALTQMAKERGCRIFGTAGSEEKIEHLKQQGVHHPINYRKEDFEDAVKRELKDEKLDITFNSLGGKAFKKDLKLVGAGGRVVFFGGAERSGKKGGLFSTLKFVWDFGWPHPIGLLMKSKGIIGVNMLQLADHTPRKLERALKHVVEWTREGKLDPKVGKEFPAEQVAEAHAYLEDRKSIGKVVLKW